MLNFCVFNSESIKLFFVVKLPSTMEKIVNNLTCIVENLNKEEGKIELRDIRIPSPDNATLLLLISCLRGDKSWFKAIMVEL